MAARGSRPEPASFAGVRGGSWKPTSLLATESHAPDPVRRPSSPLRISGKRSFEEINRSSRRSRSGPVAVHYLPAASADGPPKVAYVIPRRVGTAVERNRHRRRLRVVVREAVGVLPSGSYLVRIGPGIKDVSFQELRRRVTEAMIRASGSDAR